jgi:hypothetical protein
VILLWGERGTGKTHLLQTYRSPDRAEAHGYIFVGGSNHWHISEFEARLLDWIIGAVTAPSTSGEHQLLTRIRAIAFRAVDQFLEGAAWRQFVSRPRAGWLGRKMRWLRSRLGFVPGPSHEELKQLADNRDPAVFALLDFTKFSEYVCDRFLADKSNIGQRYALRVLLLYLFPPETETGVGHRERVLHWFRRKADDGYFARRLGVEESLDRRFAQFDAVRLLVHLFSPAVSRELATEKHPCPARVFLITFDQIEGRNELFDSDGEWRDFFAQLSELYHTLPNVVVLFTMTLGLRNRLHSLMERQFQDRIRMDNAFQLQFPQQDQVLSLYRSRVRYWLQGNDQLLEEYERVRNHYLPLNQELALSEAGLHSLRDILENLNRTFRQALTVQIAEPRLDFLVAFNEEVQRFRKGRETATDPLSYDLDYTKDHLRSIQQLFGVAGEVLLRNGLRVVTAEMDDSLDPPVVRVQFQDATRSGISVSYYIPRLGFQYAIPIQKAISNTLYWKEKLRHFLWCVRPAPMKEVDIPEQYALQVRVLDFLPELDAKFRALSLVIGNRSGYEARNQWPAAVEVAYTELMPSYFGELLKDARQRLDILLHRTTGDPKLATPEEPLTPTLE